MAKLMVFSNAKDGRDDEYNKWYDEVHLPELRSIPGVRSGQRYRAQSVDGTPPEHSYLAVYDLDRDPREVLKELAASSGETSDALDRSTVKITVWEEQ